jgi:hypothetical protein
MPDEGERPLPEPQTAPSDPLDEDSTALERTRDAADHAERTARLDKTDEGKAD